MGILDRTSSAMKVVIVIEDEPLIRELIVELLTFENYTVLQAGHAKEALEILATHAPGIALMFTDIHMPGGMNGLQLAHHVRGRWPWIALLIASGNARPLATEMPPLCRFMAKPYNHTMMLDHVQQLCC